MLQAMRNGTKSPFMKAFLVVLVGGFALWGIGDFNIGMFSGDDRAVKAGDQSVSVYDAANEFELIRRASLPGLNTGQALQVGLLEEVMEQLSKQTLFAAEADHLHLEVTRDMMRQALAGEPAFQNQFGEFRRGQFKQLLARNSFSQEGYLGRLKDTLIVEQLARSVANGGRYPSDLSQELARYQLEERTAAILRFDVRPDAIKDADPQVLSSWYEENKEAYDAPASRDLEIVHLTTASLAKDIELDEADVKRAYEALSTELSTPERREVRQMVFTSEADAIAAAAKLSDISAFDDVASELLNWTENDVRLGSVVIDDLYGDFANAVFNAKIGQLVGPVQTAFGYNIGVVDTISEAGQRSLDDVRAAIEDGLRNEAALTLLYARVNALEDALGTGASLSEAAADIDASVETVPGLAQDGTNIDGAPYSDAMADLVTDSAFLTEAWAEEIGQTGVVVASGPDSYFVLQPLSEAGARTRDLSEVQTRAMADWKREKAILVARKAADDALEENTKNAFPDESKSPRFQRNGSGLDEEAARLIAHATFEQAVGASTLVETGDTVLLIKALSIHAPTNEAVQDYVTNLAISLDEYVKDDITTALASRLSEKYKLEINPNFVVQVLVSQDN